MKKLINPKTGEVAYLNLENRTIRFSKTKGTFKVYIEEDPKSKKIEKITASAKPISLSPLYKPVEIDCDPIPEVIDSEIIDEIEKPISLQTPTYIMSVPYKYKKTDESSYYPINEQALMPDIYSADY